MRLIDADGMTEGRVENDPVVISVKCALTAYNLDEAMKRCEEKIDEAAKRCGENLKNYMEGLCDK